jgi:hypothetical protein
MFPAAGEMRTMAMSEMLPLGREMKLN